MSEYIISTSSTADLPKSYVEENGLLYFPFSFDIEGKEYKDNFGQDMSVKDFYARLRQGASSTTSMINRAAFEQGFIPHLEKGTNILHIEFSSALSGTYQNAVSAAQDLNEKYPGKLIVIDSLCASLGQGLFVDYAVQMKKQGKSMQEVADWLEANKKNIIHWFTVDDLNHLRRGGRISKASAFFGTMLQIKPVLDVDDEGRLIPHFKVKGRKKAILELLNRMKEDIKNPDGQTVFISHGDCEEDAQALKAMIEDTFQVGHVMINPIGPVVGAHSGPGTLAHFYMGKQRYN